MDGYYLYYSRCRSPRLSGLLGPVSLRSYRSTSYQLDESLFDGLLGIVSAGLFEQAVFFFGECGEFGGFDGPAVLVGVREVFFIADDGHDGLAFGEVRQVVDPVLHIFESGSIRNVVHDQCAGSEPQLACDRILHPRYCLVPLLSGGVPDLRSDPVQTATVHHFDVFRLIFDAQCRLHIPQVFAGDEPS